MPTSQSISNSLRKIRRHANLRFRVHQETQVALVEGLYSPEIALVGALYEPDMGLTSEIVAPSL